MPALTMKHVFALLKLDMFHTSDNVTLVRVRVRVRVRFRVRSGAGLVWADVQGGN